MRELRRGGCVLGRQQVSQRRGGALGALQCGLEPAKVRGDELVSRSGVRGGEDRMS